jgi:PPM family protein phosphatase
MWNNMGLDPLKVSSFGYSDIGLVRRNNEDVFLQLPQHAFYALADGMGGHNAGEVAAQETVVFLSDCIDKMFKQKKEALHIDSIRTYLESFIHHSNERIYQLGQENSCYRGMGTTLCSMLFYQDMMIQAHVGDSRIYRLRENKLTLLTHDHTLKNKFLQQGQLEYAIQNGVRYKNVLTKAIGTFKKIQPDIYITPVHSRDLYMMCSDGLSDYVTDEEISCILNPSLSLQELTLKLIQTAKLKGSCDNITVLMTSVDL